MSDGAPSYWIVSALRGHRDGYGECIARGHWQPDPQWLAGLTGPRPGDRIALRYRPGHAAPHIIVRALGVVDDGGPDPDGALPVRWLLHDLRRIVPTDRCRRPVEGPLAADDPLVPAVFLL